MMNQTSTMSHTAIKPEIQTKCKYCHQSEDLLEDENTGDVICRHCGAILHENTPTEEAEWRSYMEEGNADDYARASVYDDRILSDNALSTSIIFRNTDHSEERFTKFTKEEKRILSIHKHLQNMAEELHLSKSIIYSSLNLYKEYIKIINHSHYIDPIVLSAALLYIICRREHCFRLFIEFSITSHHSVKEIIESFKHIAQSLHLTLPLPSDEEYIWRNLLEIPKKVYENSIKVSKAIRTLQIIPQNTLALPPTIVLFTALLFNYNPKITLKEISILSTKKERIIRSLYSELYKSKDEIVFEAYKNDLANQTFDQKELFSLLDQLPPTL